MEKKERLIYLDYIRALSILIIITYHFSVGLNVGVNTDAFYINIFNKGFWGLFGVALFFLISGASLIYNYDNKLDVKEYYKKRFLGIYPAYWIAYTIVFLYSFCKYKGLVWNGPISKIIFSFLGMDGYLAPYFQTFGLIGDWFVGAIVLIYMLFPLYRKLMKKSPKIFFVISTMVFLLITIFQPFKMPVNRDLFVSSYMFILGMYFITYVKNIKKSQVLFALVLGIICLKFAQTSTMNLALLLSNLSAFFFLVVFSKIFVKSNIPIIENIVKYISKNCYYLFLLHHYIIVEIESYFKTVMLDKYGTLIVYILSWIIILILSKLLFVITKKFIIILDELMKNEKMKIPLKVAIIVIIFLTIYGSIGVYKEMKIQNNSTATLEQNNDIDYSLIFDATYYTNINSDLKNIDKELLLDHFITFGMSEGRRASYNFDVTYYRQNNEDLVQQFGDDLRLYYNHYATFGYKEGRLGSKEDIKREQFKIKIESKLLDSKNAIITLNTDVNLDKKEYYILQMLASETNIQNYKKMERVTSKEIKLEKNNITDKYVIVEKVNTDVYEQVSNFAFIQNPELSCEELSNVKIPEVNSKKGLQVSSGYYDDVENLDTSYVFTNFFMEKLLLMNYQENNTIVYEYNGKEYYFNKETVSLYDNTVSNFSNKNIQLIVSILSIKEDGYDILYYPGIDMEKPTSFYAINTTTEESQMYFEAVMSFLSNRYNGKNPEYGCITKWVVGNEVNESGTYNYMGEKNIHDYMLEYTRTFRIAYNIIKSNNSNANIYVPMEPFWGIDSNQLTYGGREFVYYLNEFIKSNGNIDWGIAYHAYSYPLNDPKILNDDIPLPEEDGTIIKDLVTKDSFYSAIITMENLDVLTEFMHQDTMLDSSGEVRSIILSEQGFTANSNVYGKCEALQAASLLYAYYKAEMNEDIDAFIYFLQTDNDEANLGNEYYKFGLSYMKDGVLNKRLSYNVFRNMDKKDSLENLSYMKNILGIEDYSNVITNFDTSKFETFMERNDTIEEKKDISKATINNTIEPQAYTSEEIIPLLDVYYEGNLLKEDKDYDLVYLNNIEEGEAKIIICGLNEFEGIMETTFKIFK